MNPLRAVTPTAAEVSADLPGDDLLDADAVLDRAFTVPATPVDLWPWLAQLGRRRAGWYFPTWLERWVPVPRRGLREVDERWQRLVVGEVVPDWGGADATLTVERLDPPRTLLYSSRRGRLAMTWCLHVSPVGGGSRVHSRVRLAGLRRPWLARSLGGLVDGLTIAGLAAGLRERVTPP